MNTLATIMVVNYYDNTEKWEHFDTLLITISKTSFPLELGRPIITFIIMSFRITLKFYKVCSNPTSF